LIYVFIIIFLLLKFDIVFTLFFFNYQISQRILEVEGIICQKAL